MIIAEQHKKIVNIALACACVALACISLFFGTADVSSKDVLSALLPFSSETSQGQLIIEKIRLPRVCLALLVGACLGVCGAASQGLFRNPLADPSLIGVSAGASLGATLVVFLSGLSIFKVTLDSTSFLGFGAISLGAFIFAVLTVWLVYGIANRKDASALGTSVTTMLLAGVAIAALSGSITSLLMYISDDQQLRKMSLWQMGSLDNASSSSLALMAIVTLGCYIALKHYASALNAFLLGESEARHLGIQVETVKRHIICIIALGVALAFASAGAIGFIGLLVPHIMRIVVGPNHKHLLTASLIGGALLLLIADTVARLVISPAEIPVGILTALLGAPFFIALLRNRGHFYAKSR